MRRAAKTVWAVCAGGVMLAGGCGLEDFWAGLATTAADTAVSGVVDAIVGAVIATLGLA